MFTIFSRWISISIKQIDLNSNQISECIRMHYVMARKCLSTWTYLTGTKAQNVLREKMLRLLSAPLVMKNVDSLSLKRFCSSKGSHGTHITNWPNFCHFSQFECERTKDWNSTESKIIVVRRKNLITCPAYKLVEEYVVFCYTLGCVCLLFTFLSVEETKFKRRNIAGFWSSLVDSNMKWECKNKRSHLCKYDVYLSNFTH